MTLIPSAFTSDLLLDCFCPVGDDGKTTSARRSYLFLATSIPEKLIRSEQGAAGRETCVCAHPSPIPPAVTRGHVVDLCCVNWSEVCLSSDSSFYLETRPFFWFTEPPAASRASAHRVLCCNLGANTETCCLSRLAWLHSDYLLQ